VIDYETYMKIRTCRDQHGLTGPQIACKLGLDPRTVEKWINAPRFCQRKSGPRASKLDPYKDQILRMLEFYPYTAIQIFQRISEDGFDGGYTIVKEYVRKVRPPKTKAYLKLAFAPGECAQVDWGSYGTVPVGDTCRRLSFFVMVLCYSRLMYVEFTVSQTMEHFLACHSRAFERFGAVPQKIMVDNLKSAVLKRAVGQDPVFNPKYLDFANHYGFTIRACAVGKGNEKGRVENGVGYVKKNFLAGLNLTDFKLVNPAALNWLDTVANVRVHRETGKKPVEMFAEEKNSLLPLPLQPYDVATISSVRASRQFRVTVDTNRYSVPAQYAGERLTLKLYPDRLCIYDQDKLVARHVRSFDRRKDFEHPDHPKPLLVQRQKAHHQKIYMRFLSLCDKAEAYYRQLEQRRMNPAHHVRKIVALSEIYGTALVARAMEDAFVFHAFSCEYIANLLEQRARKRSEPSALHLTRRQDLLDLAIQTPDMDIYNRSLTPKQEDDNENTNGRPDNQ
jgi:transposase